MRQNLKVDYRVTEVLPRVFAVEIRDKYDRAMVFCRAQEFYESPGRKFRGAAFSIWDYMRWYAKRGGRGFSYGGDWSGFNIPVSVATECYRAIGRPETPYDAIMADILSEVRPACAGRRGGYLIACSSPRGETFQHELCHARFFTDAAYRARMREAIGGLPDAHLGKFRANLRRMGYAGRVVIDEIQAYLQFGYAKKDFGSGVPIKIREKYHSLFTEAAASK